MNETYAKAGVVGGLAGLLTFFVLFTLTSSKPPKVEEINASGYDVSRVYKGILYGTDIYKVTVPNGKVYHVFESGEGSVCVLPN